MAAIVEPKPPKEGLDLKKFLQAVKHQLPSYAVPLFVRVVEKVDLTGRIIMNTNENAKYHFPYAFLPPKTRA